MIYAHTLKDFPKTDWEPLYGNSGHAIKVAERLASFAFPFMPGVLPEGTPLWRNLGLYHDMGKASTAFQHYLERSAQGRQSASVDHKTAAARWWWDGVEMNPLAIMLAYAFTGHHGGLKHGSVQFGDDYRAGTGIHLDEAAEALPPELRQRGELGIPQLLTKDFAEATFRLCFMTRILHSALVDADWLATEEFMESGRSQRRASTPFDSLRIIGQKLECELSRLEAQASGRIAALRREIHGACLAAGKLPRGVYRLNVPTGGGKTLSSLSFSLAHALHHGLERVIYVIPYTSIIDQTADEFRRVLGAHNVVEHHSNLGEDKDTAQNRYAAENWEAPLIVTTAVQFFESLFACENSRCRKLHNMAHSVIIFDEAQTLPTNLLAPCVAAMKSLQQLCGCTLVLCTATQPELTRNQGFNIGWEAGAIRSLIGNALEQRLAHEMKRVAVQELGLLSNDALIAHFRSCGEESALFIVNLTRQAQELYDLLAAQGQAGLYHLSARMCPAHRREVLSAVRSRLDAGKSTVLVATRVVEAGVDISFPVVYRDACGLDSLAQAAGRCNRHGERASGMVYSYTADGYSPPSTFVDLIDGIAARADSATEGEDFFCPSRIARYFTLFYQKRGERSNHWDKEHIMELVGKYPSYMPVWDFPEMAERFRLIPGGQVSVIMPCGAGADELRVRLLSLHHAGLMPTREDFRQAQQFSVNVYAGEWEQMKTRCDCVHERAGLYMLVDYTSYSPGTGLLRENNETSYIC